MGKLSIVVHVFNGSTQEAEAGISLVYPGQPEVHIKTLSQNKKTKQHQKTRITPQDCPLAFTNSYIWVHKINNGMSEVTSVFSILN